MELENKVPEQINDIKKENFEKLAQLFPSIIKDGQVDFKALKEELGEFEEVKEERYEFTWAGKQNAKKKVQEDVGARTLKYIEEDSKNPDTTENLYIEGDNLEVLKLLRQNYYGSIKMIYIDPPYNTGKDFVYKDNFSQTGIDSDIQEGSRDEEGNRLEINNKSSNRYHANWLNMMYPRLKVARDLLTDDGVIFISIDDNEQENLKKICDEIFGEENFIDCITWNKRVPKNDNKGIGNIHEYIVIYVKNSNFTREFTMQKEGLEDIYELLENLKKKKVPILEAEKELKKFYNKKGYDRGITLYNNLDNNYEPWGKINMSWPNAETFGPRYEVLHPLTKKQVKIPDRGWRWNYDTFMKIVDYENIFKRDDGSFICGGIWFSKDEKIQPSSIKYLKDVNKMLLRSIISLKSDGGIEVEKIFEGKNFFSYPKPISLIRILLNSLKERNGYVLDFFSGSATTAHAVMQLNAEDGGNRKYIMVQLPEEVDEKSEAYKFLKENNKPTNICEIGKERIRRAGELIKKEIEESNKQLQLGEEPKKVPDIGFKVFRTADTNINWKKIREVSKDNVMKFDDPDMLDFTLGFNDKDVVYEVLLRQRDLPLSEKLVTLTDIGSRTYLYADSYLVCLETKVTEELIENLAELNPLPIKFIFRDSAFGSKIGLKEETFRKLKTLVEKNSGLTKKAYTVEFI